MPNDYDVIVIGSGAGGGTAAWSLAARGNRVLLIERGRRFAEEGNFQDEKRMLVEMAAFDDRTFRVNGRDARLYIGGVLGGGTALYGAALLRPSREDFHPGKFYGAMLPDGPRDWPITYDDLEPYYDRAERLLGVAGDSEADMPHLCKPSAGYPFPVPEPEPINRKLRGGITRAGYRPFHLPLGIDFDRCLRCPTCPGFFCPNGARASTFSRLLDDAAGRHPLTIRTETEAERLLLGPGGTARGLRVRLRRSGTVEELTADVYVLSAGAIGSPALLMKSGYVDRSNLLGRNYMYHCGALVAGVFREPTGGAERFIKQIGFTDLYFGTGEFPHKLGYVQTLPVPGPLTVRGNAPVPIPLPVAARLNRHMLVISGAVEDLPQPDNRITLGRDGRIELRHRFHAYDIERSRWYLGRLKEVMRHTGALFSFSATGEKDDLHTAHQVGTARFGIDPASSVLDPDCRLRGYDNVFVADGSFMPTSLGVGPALTITANALRVAEKIGRDLGNRNNPDRLL